MISALSFTTPLLLLALLILPVLWWLLRAVPPAPIKRRFPGVALLLGLRDDDSQTDTTPWWLLALRIAAMAAVITAFAGPVLNPDNRATGSGPMLIVMDASWASARDWPAREARVQELLSEAQRAGRTVAIQPLTAPLRDPEFLSAQAWATRLPGITPQPFRADPAAIAAWADNLPLAEIVWLSDGLSYGDTLPLTPDRVIQSPRPIYGLTPGQYADGEIEITALRAAPALPETTLDLRAFGPGPQGGTQQLATGTFAFEAEATEATLALSLPPELRNRIQRFELTGQRSAGAVSLTDDALQRREVALMAGESDAETQNLLDPLFYLRRALAPTADLLEGALADMLPANPDVLILADVARLSDDEAQAIIEWVEKGGLLVRFAGPRLAASDEARSDEEALLPVRLRSGGRTVGGALSWGEPKTLRPFAPGSPFVGLDIPEDVAITSQVMAQPDPELSPRTIAALADGTPLVTRKTLGQGQVILFHVTANAEWSSLPLSGLFVQMLERLAISTRPATLAPEDLAGTTWTPRQVIDGFGIARDAGELAGVDGAALASDPPNAALLPGLYESGDQRRALNVLPAGATLTPATWAASVPVEGLATQPELPLMPFLLTAALFLLALDILASLWLGGRLRGALSVLALALLPGAPADAQQDDFLILQATSEITLGYVITGDTQLDAVSRAGLQGISNTLTRRTSVEPDKPIGVNLETDELSIFPLIYWPVTIDQPTPSRAAYERLNRYLRGGGLIVFDTRDADIGGFGQTQNGRKLQSLAAPLDIPPLEPLPLDHVLTRTFYLLQDFPGRHISRDVWVEAAPEAEAVEGMPFRTLNDGVTPVIIGGNDWASAWAVDSSGRPLLPVGRGFAGERQREIALRFGVNLVMHVLSGNYKSDQVHVPALLDRLGQ